MGCAASTNRKSDEQTERRENTNAKGAKPSKHADYVEDSSPPPEHLEDNDEHPTITVSVMTELRNRGRDQPSGGTVQRWIESIAEPTEADAPDVYDPARRHALSMDSLNMRLNQE